MRETLAVVLVVMLVLSMPVGVAAQSIQGALLRIVQAASTPPNGWTVSGRSPPGRWRVEFVDEKMRCWYVVTHQF